VDLSTEETGSRVSEAHLTLEMPELELRALEELQPMLPVLQPGEVLSQEAMEPERVPLV
jgi:hypothetical protein